MGVQYHPNHNKQFHEEAYGLSAKELKEEVRALLTETDAVVQVKLIDSIERLRLGYHFVEEIERLLNNMLQLRLSAYEEEEEEREGMRGPRLT
ncbi:probable terpene synthase 9 isoform X3 [Asparagus officinalis]|uniref:probable terpene synthase 9 isoform X3 n=1 Tax=Asparagus officinalis TaxID=4686 RepID=UPI00098E46A3|nr:probable terpene synthase 9 isoform X3 [Asparagus officinalis]